MFSFKFFNFEQLILRMSNTRLTLYLTYRLHTLYVCIVQYTIRLIIHREYRPHRLHDLQDHSRYHVCIANKCKYAIE